jgi:hypothetical protein
MKIKGDFTSKCLAKVEGYLKDLSFMKKKFSKVKLLRSTGTCQVDMYIGGDTNVLEVI